MKKYRVLCFLVLAFSSFYFSCSKESTDNSTINIAPPKWIQGTWLSEGGVSGFKFTNNDVINIIQSAEHSQREALELVGNSGGQVSASDESTEDTYSVTLNYPAGQTVNYSFERIADNQITWLSAQNSVYYKQ